MEKSAYLETRFDWLYFICIVFVLAMMVGQGADDYRIALAAARQRVDCKAR